MPELLKESHFVNIRKWFWDDANEIVCKRGLMRDEVILKAHKMRKFVRMR